MFDQTIHGGKSRGSRDDESDSDMDESDDDEENAVQSAPTPLPARAGPSMMSMGAPGSFVPPTPTPAQGHVAQHRSAPPMVFSDENAVPPSASKPARLNVFSDTPAKTPLAAKTPLSAKPRVIEDIREDDEPAPLNDENAVLPPRNTRTAATNNIFSTPAFKAPVRRNIFSNAITEEADEEQDEAVDGPLDHVVENGDEYAPESDENDWARMRHVGGGFNIMTPISERTMEFTQVTNLRSSQGTNIFSTSSGRRSSIKSVYQDGEDGMVEAPATAVVPALEAVREEEERAISREQSTTPDDSPAFNPTDDNVPSFEDSGNDPGRFVLPEGYTIHRTADAMQHTMVVTDRDRDTMNTMHTAKEGSPERSITNDTEAFHTAHHGDLDTSPIAHSLPNPCIPTDEAVVAQLLTIISPPLSALRNFHDLRHATSNRLDSLQSHCKSKARRSSTTPRQSISTEDNVSVMIGDREYEVSDKIGEGGFGAVFLAVDVRLREQIEDADSDDENDDDNDDEIDRSLVAIKVEKPCAVWEAVILDRIHSRLEAAAAASIIRPRNLFAFADESYLVLDFASQGTLLDAVNKAASMGIAPATTGAPSALDELVAIFFTIELLRLVDSMHRARFIHGDLKIDNCLVRLESVPASEGSWSGQYSASGENGWRGKGVKLIDFGRAIDLSLFPAGDAQKFKADWPIDDRDCLAIREDREWSFEADYHGLASICHCMLFGKYISTEVGVAPEGRDGRWQKIATPLKRVSLHPSLGPAE